MDAIYCRRHPNSRVERLLARLVAPVRVPPEVRIDFAIAVTMELEYRPS